jgi:hypothetical protein
LETHGSSDGSEQGEAASEVFGQQPFTRVVPSAFSGKPRRADPRHRGHAKMGGRRGRASLAYCRSLQNEAELACRAAHRLFRLRRTRDDGRADPHFIEARNTGRELT